MQFILRNVVATGLLLSACYGSDTDACVNGAERHEGECTLPAEAGVIADGDLDAEDPLPDASLADATGAVDSAPDVADSSEVDAGPPPDAQAPLEAALPECAQSEQCSADKPDCVGGACTGCTSSADCSRFAGAPGRSTCAPTGACVECVTSEQCLDPSKPICGGDHRCGGGCRGDQECQRQASSWTTPHCELGHGRCVECVPGALELEHCVNGNACDRVAMTCSGKPRKSVQTCGACETDTECATGLYCVATTFKDADHGTHCVLRKDTGTCPSQFAARRNAVSLLGVSAPFCFPKEAFTTCEATLDFQKPCTGDDKCGDAALSDGLCIDTDGAQQCSYACDSDVDCGSWKCGGASPRRCVPN